MPEEFVDLVDKKDKIIGKISRKEVHRKKLFHRAVYVFVRNSFGEFFLPKRAKTKLLLPGHWDFSVGEHVLAGESYKEAALRGLKEELGINGKKAKPKLLGKGFLKDSVPGKYVNFELTRVFECLWDGKIKPNEEYSEAKWVEGKKLYGLVKSGKLKCSHYFKEQFLKHYKKVFGGRK